MKIRWTRESIRLRITPGELESVIRGDSVQERQALTGWTVRIVSSDGITHLNAAGPEVTIAVSLADRQQLAEPDREGIYFDHSGTSPIRYYVEKDFPCVHPRALEALERPTETFAEPANFRKRKGVTADVPKGID